MKRLSAAIVIGWLLLVGYATALVSPSPVTLEAAEPTVTPLIPDPMPTPRVPPDKTYYRKRCWPACHYDPHWLSEEPPRETFEFEGTLGNGWVWDNEDATHWALEDGTLRIVSQSGLVGQGAPNTLLREAPAGYFDLVTRVAFEPTASGQEAGIFMKMDEETIVSIGRGYCEEADDPACLGSGIYFDGTDCERTGIPTASETVGLMLRKAGNSYVGYACLGQGLEPEADWVEVGRCYNPDASPVQVGIAATNGAQSDAPEIPANFELVTLVKRK